MPVPFIAIIALASLAALVLVIRALRPRMQDKPSATEAVLLEEAVVSEPVAPGMEGKAEIKRAGARPLTLRVKATDASLVFARGAKVRIIDIHDGLCVIESADKEHLVR